MPIDIAINKKSSNKLSLEYLPETGLDVVAFIFTELEHL